MAAKFGKTSKSEFNPREIFLRFDVVPDFEAPQARGLANWKARVAESLVQAEKFSPSHRTERLKQLEKLEGFTALSAFLEFLTDEEARMVGRWLKDSHPIVTIRGADSDFVADCLLNGHGAGIPGAAPANFDGLFGPAPRRRWVVEEPLTPSKILSRLGLARVRQKDALKFFLSLIARQVHLEEYLRWPDKAWAQAFGVEKSTISKWHDFQDALENFRKNFRSPGRSLQ